MPSRTHFLAKVKKNEQAYLTFFKGNKGPIC